MHTQPSLLRQRVLGVRICLIGHFDRSYHTGLIEAADLVRACVYKPKSSQASSGEIRTDFSYDSAYNLIYRIFE